MRVNVFNMKFKQATLYISLKVQYSLELITWLYGLKYKQSLS